MAPLNDGGFVVTWSSLDQDGSSWGVYAQRYDAAGAAVGTEFLLNQTTSGLQIAEPEVASPTVAVLPTGDIVAVWSGASGVSGYEVYARVFSVGVGATEELNRHLPLDHGRSHRH